MTVLTAATITHAVTTDDEITFAQSDSSAPLDETVEPVMTRQQLRVHPKTGPPEGFEPIERQLRLHQSDGQANMQCQHDAQCPNGDQGHGGQGQDGRNSGQGIGRGQTRGSGSGNT